MATRKRQSTGFSSKEEGEDIAEVEVFTDSALSDVLEQTEKEEANHQPIREITPVEHAGARFGSEPPSGVSAAVSESSTIAIGGSLQKRHPRNTPRFSRIRK